MAVRKDRKDRPRIAICEPPRVSLSDPSPASDRKDLAPFQASPGEHPSTAGRLHADQETVDLLTSPLVGLEGSLHGEDLSIARCGGDSSRSFRPASVVGKAIPWPRRSSRSSSPRCVPTLTIPEKTVLAWLPPTSGPPEKTRDDSLACNLILLPMSVENVENSMEDPRRSGIHLWRPWG